MKKSIEDFKAVLSTGGVRPTLYEVLLTLPNFEIITNSEFLYGEETRALPMLCKSSSIPSALNTTVTVGLPAGANLKLPGSRLYEPWDMTIINDGDMRLRNMFERWMEAIIRPDNQLSVQRLSDYHGTAQVRQLDRQGNVIRLYTLYNCFPTNIDAQQLAFDADGVTEFTVTMNYHYHEARTPELGDLFAEVF